jgi:drug/metabolite transporter (DMT)-like permease
MAVACALGEPFRLDWSAISLRSMAGLAYLVVFGSWIAYSAYVWLLKHTTPTRLSTYAYVNPVVAMLLGSVFLGEKVTAGMLLAAGVILCGVVVITLPAGVWRGAGRRFSSAGRTF